MAKKNVNSGAGRSTKVNAQKNAQKNAQQKEAMNKALRQTTVTITISVCAMVLGAALIALTWMQEGKFSIVGAIIAVGMILNMVPAVKRRRQLQDEIASNPKLYR